jgi:alpha-L-fucosidase
MGWVATSIQNGVNGYMKDTRVRTYGLLVLSGYIVLVANAFGQQERNFAVIKPGEPFEEIVRKAANVVPSPQQLAWQEREFVAFAHFGMNTFRDREWGEGKENPSAFNPTEFDAGQWVKVIKDAGMKMLIITAKHHDGFCLWPSKYTEHSVKSSPWRYGRGDVVREVARACNEFGIKFGVYLSPWDRHEGTYGDSPVYNEYFRNQLRELLTDYGEIAEVWFDGACGEGPNGKRQVYDWQSYYKVIRELQPQAVIAIMGPDVRWVGTESGYGRETEWSVVPIIVQNPDTLAADSQQYPVDRAFAPRDLTDEDLGSREKIKNATALVWYPAETDVSIRPGWFYHESHDDRVKSPEKLVDIYYSSVGRNSLLLLNVPPDKRGRIHENDIKSLTGMCKILDQTFKTNLVAGARVKASNEKQGHEASFVIDRENESYWTTDAGVESAVLEFDLGKKQTFDRAMLQENIRVGQRVEAFRIQAWDGGEWKECANGTTIGYKRLLRFPVVTAQMVRLVIEGSRTSPTLFSFGLFKAPPRVVIEPNGGAFESSLQVRLSSDTEGMTIRHTLDGSEPTSKSARYTGPIRLTNSSTLKAVAVFRGELSPEPTVAQFIKCMKVKEAAFEKPYSDKYPGQGDATIINGRRGTLDFHDGEWLGFNGDDVVLTLDLGGIRSIKKITAGFLQEQGAWIFLPSEVKFFVSGDGVNWTSAGELKKPIEQTERVVVKDLTCVIGNAKSRFVRIAAKNIGVCPSWHPGAGDKAWLFVDEVIVE